MEGTPSKWGLPCLWVEGGLQASPSQEARSLSASVHPAGQPLGQNHRRAAVSELVARPQGPEPTAETQGSLPAGSELRQSQPGRVRPRREGQRVWMPSTPVARGERFPGALPGRDRLLGLPGICPSGQEEVQGLTGSDCRAPVQAVPQGLRAGCPRRSCKGLSLCPQPGTSPVCPGEGGPDGHRGVGGRPDNTCSPFSFALPCEALASGKQPLPPLLPSPLPLWPGLIQTQVMRMKPRPRQREARWVCSQSHPLDEGTAPGKWPLPSKGRSQRSRRCVSLTARPGWAGGRASSLHGEAGYLSSSVPTGRTRPRERKQGRPP